MSLFCCDGETYTSTTSLPLHLPVFLTVALTVITSFLLLTESLVISNLVYDLPNPNGYKGLTFALSKYLYPTYTPSTYLTLSIPPNSSKNL